MSRYDYTCTCGENKEVEKPMGDKTPIMCKCGKEMKKEINGTWITSFEGDGFTQNILT